MSCSLLTAHNEQTWRKLHADLMRKLSRQAEMIFGDAEGEGRGNAGEGGGGVC